MHLPALLYALKLISRTKFNALSSELTATERKQTIKLVKSFRYLVSFKLAATCCITYGFEETSKIKSMFKHYDCLDDYKDFIKLKAEYPSLVKKLKYRGYIPVSNEEVQNNFYLLYQKYEDYIGKYVNKKLRILINKYRSFEDVRRDFLANILVAYYQYFLNPNKAYVENCFKLCIRNYGKLLLESATYKKKREINNSLTSESKIEVCSITEELANTLKAKEKEGNQELRHYILHGTSKGAMFCRCLLAFVDEKSKDAFKDYGLRDKSIDCMLYSDWLSKHGISINEAKKNPVKYARQFLEIDDATFARFKKEFIEAFL